MVFAMSNTLITPTPEQATAPDTPAARRIALGRRVIAIECEALEALALRLDHTFAAAVALILGCQGRVVVSGVGKSGHIARKMAATFASTGTPAFFVHAAEASHGDLGMVTPDDLMIALSYSGESEELNNIVPHVKRQGAKLIVISGNPESTLSRHADVHLDARVAKEACPLNLAPTASTTATLALGDALAVVCLEARGFGAEDFARSHPGGSLGRKLLTLVSDVMRVGAALPVVAAPTPLPKVILEMSKKAMGMVIVTAPDGRLEGVFTDGDLRRAIEREVDLRTVAVGELMTLKPRSIGPGRLAIEAAQVMEDARVAQLVVIDAHEQVVGALTTLDLLRAKVL